jgi:hypothetical protein
MRFSRSPVCVRPCDDPVRSHRVAKITYSFGNEGTHFALSVYGRSHLSKYQGTEVSVLCAVLMVATFRGSPQTLVFSTIYENELNFRNWPDLSRVTERVQRPQRTSLLERRSLRWLLSNGNSDRAADDRGDSNDWHEV